jgi:protein-S-isoprenylcysteine O-methyltransferase Ste14
MTNLLIRSKRSSRLGFVPQRPPDQVLNHINKRKLDFLWVAISIGLAIFTWRNAIRDGYAPILLYVALHLQAAILFAIRNEARASSARPLEVLVTLASLNYFLAYDPVPISSSNFAALGGFVTSLGALLALVSNHCLGRSFGVLPSLRTIQTRGIYNLIRHPIYMSYMVMEIGILIRHPRIYNAAVALAGVVLMLWRIQFEERILKQDDGYLTYMKAVPYRLIPHVY